MLRFIIKRQQKCSVTGLETSCFETVDIDVPELEAIILGGGTGNGGYDVREVAGIEALPASPGDDPSAHQVVVENVAAFNGEIPMPGDEKEVVK